VHRAIGAARQRFAEHLAGASGARRARHHLSAVLLTQSKRLFERVRIRLVHLEAGVLLADPAPGVIHPRLPLLHGHLLDTDRDPHWRLGDWRLGDWVEIWRLDEWVMAITLSPILVHPPAREIAYRAISNNCCGLLMSY
jgi:hypothetical protein